MKGPEERETTSACSAEWLVEKSRQAIDLGDQFAAKSWLLTAKTLYPRAFSVQFEAFQMERRSGKMTACGKLFFDMIKSFPKEDILWNELRRLVQSLEMNNSELDSESLFLKEMAENLPLKYQRELLLRYADHQTDLVERCRISLVVMKKFHGATRQYGLKLTEQLMKAEQDDKTLSPVNIYRKMLVCDVLPVILKSTEVYAETSGLKHKANAIFLPEQQFFTWLELTIEFFLTYSIQQTNLKNRHFNKISSEKACQNTASNLFEDDSVMRHTPWHSLFDTFMLFASKCGWSHLLKAKDKLDPGRIKSIKSKWRTLNNIKDAKSSWGVFYSVLQLYFCAVIEYCSIMTGSLKGQRDASSSGFILLETLDTLGSNQQVQPARSPKKKRKHEDSSTAAAATESVDAANIPYLSGISGQLNDLTDLLQVAADCKQLLTSNPVFGKEFARVQLDWQVDRWRWMQICEIDSLIHQRHYDDVITSIRESGALQNLADQASSQFQAKQFTRLAMCYYCLGDRQKACEMAVNAIFSASNSAAPDKETSDWSRKLAIKNSTDGRSFEVVRCCPHQITGFNVEVLIAALKEKLASVDIRPDRDKIGPLYDIRQDDIIGHIIVLLQFNWPKKEALFEQLLKSIKTLGGLRYEEFFRYVTNVDILEEFAHLNNLEKVQLELQGATTAELSSRKTVTRGVNRENKEDFRSAMEAQVARCHEPIQQLILTFLQEQQHNLLSLT